MGPWDTPIRGHNLKVFTQVCHQLGVPLALEKVEGPATCLTFLGISIDSHSMLTSLPNEKLERIRNEVSVWLSRKTATKKQILSLMGLLTQGNHVTKKARLDLPHLQVALQEYFANGAARSTWRTYSVGQRRYLSFCAAARRQAVPITETTLMLFTTDLATSGLTYQQFTIYM